MSNINDNKTSIDDKAFFDFPFEKENQQLLDIFNPLLSIINAEIHPFKLMVTGSRAKHGLSHPLSDLNIAVVTDDTKQLEIARKLLLVVYDKYRDSFFKGSTIKDRTFTTKTGIPWLPIDNFEVSPLIPRLKLDVTFRLSKTHECMEVYLSSMLKSMTPINLTRCVVEQYTLTQKRDEALSVLKAAQIKFDEAEANYMKGKFWSMR